MKLVLSLANNLCTVGTGHFGETGACWPLAKNSCAVETWVC
jgi:hypothetical protein